MQMVCSGGRKHYFNIGPATTLFGRYIFDRIDVLPPSSPHPATFPLWKAHLIYDGIIRSAYFASPREERKARVTNYTVSPFTTHIQTPFFTPSFVRLALSKNLYSESLVERAYISVTSGTSSRPRKISATEQTTWHKKGRGSSPKLRQKTRWLWNVPGCRML